MSSEPRPRTLLGFDFGAKRIGVALGEELTRTARPLTTLNNLGDFGPDWGAIEKLITTWEPDALVVGLPCHMDGSEHEMTSRARRFGHRLQGRTNLPLFFRDERLSSEAAEQELQDAGHDWSDKGRIDAYAARIILEDWLGQSSSNLEQTP